MGWGLGGTAGDCTAFFSSQFWSLWLGKGMFPGDWGWEVGTDADTAVFG